MTPTVTRQGVRIILGIAGLFLLLSAYAPGAAQSPAKDTPGVPAFLQPERCYRFTFAVTGAPNWKVLEVVDGGWIKAEIDAGPAEALREAVWVNTSQIITARERRCSG